MSTGESRIGREKEKSADFYLHSLIAITQGNYAYSLYLRLASAEILETMRMFVFTLSYVSIIPLSPQMCYHQTDKLKQRLWC